MPLLLYPVVDKYLDHENHENRALVTWESIREEVNWKDFFPKLELIIEDNVFYKNESVKLVNFADEVVFKDLFNSSVMVGKENWLFYKRENCIQDYRGTESFDDEQLQKYADAASHLQKVLSEMGVRLYLMITPNKESIYGDRYLPDKVERVSNVSKADQVVQYLNDHTSCTVVYPKDALIQASYEYQVWKKYDTHWNERGAYVAFCEFLRAVGIETCPLENMVFAVKETCTGDLANMLGMGTRFHDDAVLKTEHYLDEVCVEQTEHVQQPNLDYSLLRSDAEQDESILFIGDSFLGSMEIYAAKNYKTTMFVHRNNYRLLEKDLFETEKPNIIVLQTAERFLTSFDDWCEYYAHLFLENGEK